MKSTSKPRSVLGRLLRGGILLAISILVLGAGTLAVLAFWPLGMVDIPLKTAPIEDYAEAHRLIQTLRREAPEGIRPECRAIVLDHGRKTDDVYVLMHGLTNCPAQFQKFGEMLHAQGANVLIPRTPYHGFIEDSESQQHLLTWQDILNSGNFAVDIAHAFGTRITVIGLSVNGATAAWLAQKREDVDRAVLLSPFFVPAGIQGEWILPVGRLVYRLPNSLVWWDSKLKDQLEGPDYAYPRFATHSISHVMRIGLDVVQDAEKEAPLAKRILIVTTASDAAVNNGQTARIEQMWKEKAPGRVTSYQFPKEDQVPHDCIDPHQAGARLDLVYPKLLELIQSM